MLYKRMKVAFVDTSNFSDYPIGGQLTSVRNMLRYFSGIKDIEIVLIGISDKIGDKNSKSIVIENKSIELIRVYTDSNEPNKPKKSLRLHFLLGLVKNIRAIRKMNIDVFFLHTPEAFLPIKLLIRRAKIATFSHGSFYNIFDHIRFKRFKLGFVKRVLKFYIESVIKKSNILFVLDDQSYNEYLPLNKNVIKVINSIDVSKYNVPSPSNRLDNLVYVGRLSANKRVDEIIRFISISGDMRLDIYGYGEEYERLEQLIEKLNLGERVKLKGSVANDELINVLPGYDALVLNSIVEGMPMVLLEGMAAGLVIFTTRVGAIGEIVKESKNGFFTDGTAESLYEAYTRCRKHNVIQIKDTNREAAMDFDFRNVNKVILDGLMRL